MLAHAPSHFKEFFMIHRIFIRKANKSIDVDFDNLPDHVKAHIVEYGLKQKFNDVHSAEPDGAKAYGLATNLLERLEKGDLAKRVAVSDPIEKEFRVMLLSVAKIKTGKKAKDLGELSTEEVLALVATALGKPEARVAEVFKTKAAAIVAERQRASASLLDDIEI